MKKAPPTPNSLRVRSERRLREKPPGGGDTPAKNDIQRLFHELQVHQIELELQNEELHSANAAANSALERYTDLYDFAPVGYFSMDEKGLMVELNMAGAVLLKVERSRLVGRRFQLFVAPKDRPFFQTFIDRMFAGTGRQYCEVELLRGAADPLWVELTGLSVPTAGGATRTCRIVVTDISARKLAEKEHKHVGILATANRALTNEIELRRQSEAALLKSEQRFRKLLEQSRLLQARMRLMTHEMLKVQEDQRKTISRELHDEVSQILLGINVQLAIFVKSAVARPQDIKRAIGPVRRMVEKAVRIVHRFARELRPAMLDDLGLIPTLRTHIEDLSRRKGFLVRMSADPSVETLNNDERTVLYRIAQEALTNVAKHAHASIVEVRLLRTPKGVCLEVADNGRAFNVARLATSEWRNRLGVTGMRERVEMLGGQLTVVSEQGKGTSVRADIPDAPKAAAKQR